MYQEYLAEVRQISKHVLESRRTENGPQDTSDQSKTTGAAPDGQPQQGLTDDNLSESKDTDEEFEESPPPKICGLRKILDGMPEEWKDNEPQTDDSNNMLEEPKKPRITDAISEILKGMPMVVDRRASLHARKFFLEELSKTLNLRLAKTQIDGEPQTQTPDLQPGVEATPGKQPKVVAFRPQHRYTEMLDSLASTVEDMDQKNFNVSDKNSYAKKLDEMVKKTGDEGLIKSWTAKKKRQADRLAFGTRSQAQMVHAMLNVKEFEKDSRSYSIWLDNAAPAENNRNGSINNQESEPQTSENLSLQSEVGKSSREPRFREQSAANFLKNSVAEQILHEFSHAKKPKNETRHKSADPNEPRFSEVPAANFLAAVSDQILEEFTDKSDQSQTSDKTEGRRERRFREKSALKFLAALEEQLRPEFKSRHGSAKTSEAGRTRFREKSAVNFLDALRAQIVQSPNQIPPPDVASSSDQSVQSETVRALEESPLEEAPLEEESFLGEAHLEEGSSLGEDHREEESPPEEAPLEGASPLEEAPLDEFPLEDKFMKSDQTIPLDDPSSSEQIAQPNPMQKPRRRSSTQ